MSSQEYILEEIKNLRSLILRTRTRPTTGRTAYSSALDDDLGRPQTKQVVRFQIPSRESESAQREMVSTITEIASGFPGVAASGIGGDDEEHWLKLLVDDNFDKDGFQSLLDELVRRL